MKKPKYNLHFRRLEFKYVVPSVLVDALVPTITRYMYLDPYVGKESYYIVNSIYFDSKDFITFYQKTAGIKFRKKYRIRYYNDESSKLFFEIKRKTGDTVIKDRIFKKIRNNLNFSSIFDLKQNVGSFNGNPDFHLELVYDYQFLKLEPKIFIGYKRIPYISKYNNNLRITFDCDIKARRRFDLNSLFINRGFYSINDEYTILEIKFNGNIPGWLSYIIKSQNLTRVAMSKYAIAVEKIYGLC